MAKSGSRRIFLERGIGLALLFLGRQTAQAHARLTRSHPKDGAKLSEAPERIDLWFNELLEGRFNTVQLFRADDERRANLAKEKPEVNAKDRTHLTITAPKLGPGDYVVEYRVLSRDGHTSVGRFRFIIVGKARN